MNKYLNIILICALFLCASCDKDVLNDNQDTGSGEAIPVNFVIGSIEEIQEASGTRSGECDIQTFTQPLDPKEDTGINVTTTIESVPYAEGVQTRSTQVANGVIFRMEVFDAAGSSVSNGLFKVNGTSATLIQGTSPVLTPGTYNFVSYTFLETEADGLMNLNSSGKIGYSIYGDWYKLRDFSIFCQKKTLSATDNSVAINFKRQKSTLEISAKVNNQTASFTNAVRQVPRVLTWSINSNTTEENMWIVSKGALEPYKQNVVYDVIPFSNSEKDSLDTTFTINGLQINGKDYGTKVIDVPLEIKPNRRYRIIFNFETIDIIVAGTTWAPGNLMLVNGIYKFAESQRELGDNFSLNDYTDYCKLVAPANTWRLPTKAECQNLIDSGLEFEDNYQNFAVCSNLCLSSLLTNPGDGIELNIFVYPTSESKTTNDGKFRVCLMNNIFENSGLNFYMSGYRDITSPIRCVKNQN